MSIGVRIEDGEGRGYEPAVEPSLALRVSQIPVSARGVPGEVVASQRLLSERLSDATGVTSQKVDGSTSPVEYAVRSSPGVTRWITGFRVLIYGANLDLGSAGQARRYSDTTAPGLANGVEIEVHQNGNVTNIADLPIQNIANYLQYSSSFTNLVNGIASGEDFLRLDFMFETPVVLLEGGTDRLLMRINDDLSAGGALGSANADQFALAFGYEEAL